MRTALRNVALESSCPALPRAVRSSYFLQTTFMRFAITLNPDPRALCSTRHRPRTAVQGDAFRDRCAQASRKQPPLKETTGERSHRSAPVWWAWLDLNQRPHPETKIARVPTGSAAPRAERGRHTRFSSLVAAPGHGGLIRDGRPSTMLSSVFPGRWRASGAKGGVLTPCSHAGRASQEAPPHEIQVGTATVTATAPHIPGTGERWVARSPASPSMTSSSAAV